MEVAFQSKFMLKQQKRFYAKIAGVCYFDYYSALQRQKGTGLHVEVERFQLSWFPRYIHFTYGTLVWDTQYIYV